MPRCGNGRIDMGETCDTAIPPGAPGACPPSDCDDRVPCTTDVHNGDGCNAACAHDRDRRPHRGGRLLSRRGHERHRRRLLSHLRQRDRRPRRDLRHRHPRGRVRAPARRSPTAPTAIAARRISWPPPGPARRSACTTPCPIERRSGATAAVPRGATTPSTPTARPPAATASWRGREICDVAHPPARARPAARPSATTASPKPPISPRQRLPGRVHVGPDRGARVGRRLLFPRREPLAPTATARRPAGTAIIEPGEACESEAIGDASCPTSCPPLPSACLLVNLVGTARPARRAARSRPGRTAR